MEFEDRGIQRRFEKACRFIGRLGDNDSLEMAASMHMLRKTTGLPDGAIVARVAAKLPRLTGRRCGEIWGLMGKEGLV